MVRLLFCFVLVFSLGCSARGQAQDTQNIVLKPNPVSQNGTITLSDLFDVSGKVGQTPLARAPEPGERVALDPYYVKKIAQKAGYNWANAAGFLRIYVERASRLIGDEELRQLISEAIYIETGRVHEIQLSNARKNLAVPLDQIAEPILISLDRDARTGLFRAEIAAWDGGVVRRIGGRALSVVEVPVLKKVLQRGEIIEPEDVEWKSIRSDTIRPTTISEMDVLIGMATRRALRPGYALRENDITAPIMINRGEVVSLSFKAGPLSLTAKAKALTNASKGERIRLVNLQSNRTVEAIVEAPGQARVFSSAVNY